MILQQDKQLGEGEEEGEEQYTPVKYVPCNTMEKFCPLPRSQRKLRKAPRPLGACTAGKRLGSARGLAALLAPVLFSWPRPHLTVGQLTQ